MNRENIRLLLASIITIFIGPGVGHILFKQWKRALFFISLAIGLFLLVCVNFVSDIGPATLEPIVKNINAENLEQFKNIYLKFQEDNSKMMLIYDVLLAGLWAYSIVDLFRISNNKTEKIK